MEEVNKAESVDFLQSKIQENPEFQFPSGAALTYQETDNAPEIKIFNYVVKLTKFYDNLNILSVEHIVDNQLVKIPGVLWKWPICTREYWKRLSKYMTSVHMIHSC